MTVLLNGVLVIIVLCLCCDVLECMDVRRRDVHRIVLKTRSRGRPKKSLHSRPADNHNRYYFPKEPNYDPYTDHYGESSSVHQEIYHNPNYYQKNRYKNRTPHKEYDNYAKYEKQKPDVLLHGNTHFDGYSGRGQYFDYETRPESSNNLNYAIDYRNFKRYKDIMDYYNRKQEEEYQKELVKAKRQEVLMEQQQKQREIPWTDSGEAFSQEESIENPVWQSSNDNYYKAVWNPILSDSKSEKEQTKRKQNRYNKRANNIEYIIDMTTSKPQKVPVTIFEENSSEELSSDFKTVNYNFEKDLYPNHKASNEINQESNQSSYEVFEEESVSPIVGRFQNIAPMETSYSTLWKQLADEEVPSATKKKEGRKPYGAKSKPKRFKRPAYSTF